VNIPEQVEVVVVGAGPTGLALGCVLRRSDVDVLVVDRAALGTNESRAAVVHARTLEVLEELDVTARMVAEGLRVPVFAVRNGRRRLAGIEFAGLPTPYPYTLMLSQARTEAILAGRLGELGGQVCRPWAASRIEGTVLTLAGPDGAERTVRARYVVGADGMHSAVREQAGIGFTGGRYAQSFVLADVRMDWPLPPGEVQLFLAVTGLVVVAPLPGGHHRVVATLDAAPETVAAADVQALLDERGPGDVRVRELVWGSRFRVHHRVADAYRAGPVLLAGDAAHVHSPAGGQGMNTGIQDAVDLGHTLVEVLRNGQPDATLDAYQARRRPVAQRVVRLTDRATRMATVSHPVARAARDAAIRLVDHVPAARRRIALQLSEIAYRPEVQRRKLGAWRSS
jgi:2-polyprenyl-6-methoxyphenol hydroxylase-like FAD-dependent oxidoreductase